MRVLLSDFEEEALHEENARQQCRADMKAFNAKCWCGYDADPVEPYVYVVGPQFMAGPEQCMFLAGCPECRGQGFIRPNGGKNIPHPNVRGGLPDGRRQCEPCRKAAMAFIGPLEARFYNRVIREAYDEAPWRYAWSLR